jgi:hypothetical protein
MHETVSKSVREGGATLWVLRNKHNRIVQCVARLARAGVELEILSDGSSMLVHRFGSGFEAMAWAADVRELWSNDGESALEP